MSTKPHGARDWDDKRTKAQKDADALHRRVAILAVMAEDYTVDHPNAMALAARRKHGMPIYASLGRGGFRPGSGTAIAGVVTSMQKRGLIRWTPGRYDGLSGSSYAITSAGEAYLAEHRAVLDTPWYDVAPAED